MVLTFVSAGVAALMVVGSPIHAQLAASVPPAAAEQASATALAELVSPGDLLIPMEVELARQGLSLGFQSEPEGKQLVQEHPGLVNVLWAAIEPEVRKSAVEEQPRFIAELAKIYTDRLTPAEIEALRKFYSTATGRKLIRGMYANVDAAPAFEDVLKSDGTNVSKEALATIHSRAAAKAASTIGEEDRPALEDLMRNISLSRMKAVGELTQKFTAEWVNKADPILDARMDELLSAAMEKYFAERGTAR